MGAPLYVLVHVSLPLGIARIIVIVSEAFLPNHTDMRQMTPNSLSERHLLASLQVPLATCNHLHMTWKWLMGSPSILISMLINNRTLPHTSTSKLKGWATA